MAQDGKLYCYKCHPPENNLFGDLKELARRMGIDKMRD